MPLIDFVRSTFRQLPEWAQSTFIAFGSALLIVVLVYPDVVFFGKSFRASEIRGISPFSEAVTEGRGASSYVPEPPGRTVLNGTVDTGGSGMNMDPAHYFMRYVLYNGQSPYWNPYLAAGSAGPETLLDAKFSVVTITIALLGAGSLAFHVAKLGFLVLGTGFLYLILQTQLKLSHLAALTGCFVYVLNGFAQSQLHSALVHPYLLAPVVLFALMEFHRKPTVGRFVAAVAAHAAILFESFIPTVLLALIAVHGLSLAYLLTIRGRGKEFIRALALHCGVAVLAVLLSSPLWLPFVDNMTNAWEYKYYQERNELFAADAEALLSVFTPKHFWESYEDLENTRPFSLKELNVDRASRWVYHLGIVACVVSAYGFRASTRFVWFRRCAALFFVLGVWRVFPVFPMDLIVHVPVLKIVRGHYWGVLWCFSFSFVAAFGVQTLLSRKVGILPGMAVYVVLAFAFLIPMSHVGIPDNAWTRFYLSSIGAVAAASALLVCLLTRNSSGSKRAIAVTLLALLVIELHWYSNHYRSPRITASETELQRIIFLQENLGAGRVFNMESKVLIPNWGAGLQIPQIGNINSMQWPHYHHFFTRHIPRRSTIYTLAGLPADPLPNLRALNILGVRYVLLRDENKWRRHRDYLESNGYALVSSDTRSVMLENPATFPRAFTVPLLLRSNLTPIDFARRGASFATTNDQRLAEAATAAGVILLEEDSIPQIGGNASTPAAARIAEYRNARVVVECSVSTPSVLVLMDTWHRDWKATVNDEAAHLGRVNEAFRGVVLSPGNHTIEFRYAPRTLPVALGAVLLSLLVLVAVVIQRRRFASVFGDR